MWADNSQAMKMVPHLDRPVIDILPQLAGFWLIAPGFRASEPAADLGVRHSAGQSRRENAAAPLAANFTRLNKNSPSRWDDRVASTYPSLLR
jgi:hypothetical protein